MVDQCIPAATKSGDEVTAGEAAYILGVSVKTLYWWRCMGRHTDKIGPYQYGKFGRYRYLRSELEAFKLQKMEPTKTP